MTFHLKFLIGLQAGLSVLAVFNDIFVLNDCMVKAEVVLFWF